MEDYNPAKKRIVLIVFDDMIADMESNKKLSPMVTELILRGRKLNISLVFISQSYLKVTKTVRLSPTHFMIKIPNKRKRPQIASNHSSDIDFKDFMKLYNDYTKEPYLFLVNDTILSSDNSLQFRRTYYKMSISEKIKRFDNKIEQNKTQYNLDRQTAKISPLSLGNRFLTGKDVLSEKDLLEKAAALKRFEYSTLGKELKSQTDIAKKQYQN